ncbi:hypothetical protein HA145_03445 [Prochlorococcus marinus XMU1411]|uniref:hypothetical protein n=1 Tax=Prochlorococcus marinus TaxID=1219 RepID=UPI001ADCE8B0|nr:hypothetical protein [Prochlorococcus marinus]MBO8243529.1 hypothetical protein [Prochlorococcus marinus XMU1411]MBW3054643.1 hypothetical protein [Prochlorococcus marinus str. MU1411]MCR8538222.1 hypothetical protein [Prochlorococcus marinus CUG1430]
MKNYNHLPYLIWYVSLTLASIFFVTELNSEEQKNNSLVIEDGSNTSKIMNDILRPMPIGDFKSASQRVNINRNPFQDPAKSELTNIDDIYSALVFKGIARSGGTLVAIIETDDVQKIYEVGDLMDNGFTIDSISYEETSVEVSNGSRKYKLILSGLKYEN